LAKVVSEWLLKKEELVGKLTYESRKLIRRLLTKLLFLFWTSAITEPFPGTSTLLHDGFFAITEPFHELFFLVMELRLSWSPFTNFSFS
jgi:hypothetical protein